MSNKKVVEYVAVSPSGISTDYTKRNNTAPKNSVSVFLFKNNDGTASVQIMDRTDGSKVTKDQADKVLEIFKDLMNNGVNIAKTANRGSDTTCAKETKNKSTKADVIQVAIRSGINIKDASDQTELKTAYAAVEKWLDNHKKAKSSGGGSGQNSGGGNNGGGGQNSGGGNNGGSGKGGGKGGNPKPKAKTYTPWYKKAGDQFRDELKKLPDGASDEDIAALHDKIFRDVYGG